MSSPLVSVVIPAYGAEEFIEFTMRSVAAQTYRPIELVVVEDCSPDATGEVATRVAAELAADDFSVRVEHHPENRGGAAALQTGFGLARGDYICWLSADDAYYSAAKTANQVDTMLSTGAGLTYDAASYIGPTPEEANLSRPHWWTRRIHVSDDTYMRFPTWRLLALMFGNPMNGSSVMIRQDVIEAYATFDPALRNIDQDSDMWQRLSALRVRFAITDQAGVFYRIHPGQTSNLTDAVERGCTMTRVRVLLALLETRRLGTMLNRAWPVLLLTRPSLFLFRPTVAAAVCHLGARSKCGPVPRVLLWGLRRAMMKLGYWDEARLHEALAEARESAQSNEFQRFIALLQAGK